MIDYKKHRERWGRATRISGKYDKMIVRTNAAIYLSRNNLDSRCYSEDEAFILGLINDAEELLYKAEKMEWYADKWDKNGRILIKIRERNEAWVEEIILEDFREEHGLATEKKTSKQKELN